MRDFERRGLPSLSKSRIGPSVAHSSLKPITDSISSMVPMCCLKMITMTSHSYGWISFVTPIVEETNIISISAYIITEMWNVGYLLNRGLEYIGIHFWTSLSRVVSFQMIWNILVTFFNPYPLFTVYHSFSLVLGLSWNIDTRLGPHLDQLVLFWTFLSHIHIFQIIWNYPITSFERYHICVVLCTFQLSFRHILITFWLNLDLILIICIEFGYLIRFFIDQLILHLFGYTPQATFYIYFLSYHFDPSEMEFDIYVKHITCFFLWKSEFQIFDFLQFEVQNLGNVTFHQSLNDLTLIFMKDVL